MNEVCFRNWLVNNNVRPKVVSDTISRLKRVERELENCDIDEQYDRNKCKHLLNLFLNMGENNEMRRYQNSSLPIGKYYMSTYRYAIKMYIKFLEDTTLDTK